LSPDGSCKTFDERANGYVRGEGAAFVLLKPLKQAIQDKDKIVGVVRGTAINHGGHARTVTYPGSHAQSKVIAEAISQANIPVNTIGYVEAHGTGTPKGDPIEIEGLKQAFTRVAKERGEVLQDHTCGLGSVKANIGHLESVAGMAGLIKTLLCMRHQVLPSLVHYQKINPRISLEGSPFYIVDQVQTWPALLGQDGQAIPRRAGISSFGFGGVNSHIVVEEYNAPINVTNNVANNVAKTDAAAVPKTTLVLIVLSAKSALALRARVEQLLGVMADSELSAMNLTELAYTLQVGRYAMSERLAIVADSIESLQNKLRAWLSGDVSSIEVFTGQVTSEMLAAIADQVQDDASMASLYRDKRLSDLASKWLIGHTIDWTLLYGAEKPKRLALPTYPFAKEKHWIVSTPAPANDIAQQDAVLHPLLHRNTSDLLGLRFTSRFTGAEFFLTDHIVHGIATMPGVAQLEMVFCAARELLGDVSTYLVTDVVWARPMVYTNGVLEVHIALLPEQDGSISFDIYSDTVDDEVLVYSRGNLIPKLNESTNDSSNDSPSTVKLNIPELREQCTEHLNAAQCYVAFEQAGLHYGAAHQGISAMFVGTRQALGQIKLPMNVQASFSSYELHPSILDAALQTALLLQASATTGVSSMKLVLPFALSSFELLAPCEHAMWAVVRYCAGSAASDHVQKFDIDLCDEAGVVCVRFKEFCARIAPEIPTKETLRTALFQPDWKIQAAKKQDAKEFAQHLVFLCGNAETHAQRGVWRSQVTEFFASADCRVVGGSDHLALAYESAVSVLLECLQSLNKLPGQHLIQIIVPSHDTNQLFAGLGGMLRSAHLENPRITGQVISIEFGQDILPILTENRYSQEAQIRYIDGVRMVGVWNELTSPVEAAPAHGFLKDNGVYLITGGIGGLGLIFARDIASKVNHAKLILTGRSPISESVKVSLRELEILGAVVQYRSLDVGDATAVTQLVQSLPEEFESLDGIIHSAGVLRDSLIINKTVQQVHEVLRAKVEGVINLDQASKDIALDFFVSFSSTSGALGNLGQADYAAANSFMDAYAHYRNEKVIKGERYGRTLAVNWPLWQAGGMQVNATVIEEMTRRTGLIALSTASGCSALELSLSSDAPQVMVVEGEIGRFKASLLVAELVAELV
ncbi:MAG: SDR family NAD(P)-dependent oxidoreductase, partial [Undibacterium sp.]|nr:SDR family NAD(P)-dependent oxidoreductase [Undibacterium sp.]